MSAPEVGISPAQFDAMPRAEKLALLAQLEAEDTEASLPSISSETQDYTRRTAQAQNMGGGRIVPPNSPALGESSFLEEELIPMLGETIVPLMTEKATAKTIAKAIPNPFAKGLTEVAISGAAAYAGRFAGEELNEEMQDFIGSKYAPEINQLGNVDTMDEAARSASFDMAMNGAFKLGRGALRKFGVTPDAALSRWDALLDKHGGSMTLGQIADEGVKGNLLRGIEEVLRGGAGTKGVFRVADEKNVTAVAGIIAERSNELTQEALGKLILDNLQGGKELQSHLAGELFLFLDELPTSVPKVQASQPAVGNWTGANAVTTPVERMLPPVDVTSTRINAGMIGKKLESQGGFTDIEGRLSSLAKGDGHLTFKDTHDLLSRVKRAQREGVFADVGIAEVEVGGLISHLQKSFDAAGEKIILAGDETATNLYQQARKYTQEGHDVFSTDYLKALVNNDPSRVGATLAGATPTEIRQLRRMVDTADDKMLEASGSSMGSSWKDIQEGYVSQLFPMQFANDPAMFLDSISGAPAFRLLGSSPADRQFQEAAKEIMGEAQLAQMQQGLVVLRDTLLETPSLGSLTAQQTATMTGGVREPLSWTARVLGTVLTPFGAAKLFTDPALIRTLIKWKAAKPGSSANKRAALKLLGGLDDIAQDSDVRGVLGLGPAEEEAAE